MQAPSGGAAAPPADSPSPPPTIHWIGPPTFVEQNRVHYRAAKVSALEVTRGDFVYLQPAEPGVPLYIARVEDLMHINPPYQDSELPQQPAGAGLPAATVTWFYRPQELDLDAPLAIFENEVFAADDTATHQLDSVAGKCSVVEPKQQAAQLGSGEGAASRDFYVCSRKYIPSEGRVVPLPGVEELVNDSARTYILNQGRILPRQMPSTPTAVAPAPAAPKPISTRVGDTTKRRKRKSASPNALSPTAGTPTGSGGYANNTSSRKRQSPRKAAAPAASGSVSQGRAPSHTSAGGGVTTTTSLPPPSPTGGARTPKEHHGRWNKERYDAAKRSLINILRLMGATSPDVGVLRPVLREEARKVIGDTGLLDHLLKHLADQVVSPEGERLRRRHNREGHMEYWLQNPAAAEHEEEMMKEELTALTSELREVREARHVLQTVKNEAVQAIQAVSGLKEHPEEAAASLAGVQPASELTERLQLMEREFVALQRRLHDAESLAASGLEEVRRDMGEAGKMLGEHIAGFDGALGELGQRCAELERKAAVLAGEDAAGRFEAVSAALSQAVATGAVLRQELTQRDAVIAQMQQEMMRLRQDLGAVVASLGGGSGVAQQAQQQGASPPVSCAPLPTAQVWPGIPQIQAVVPSTNGTAFGTTAGTTSTAMTVPILGSLNLAEAWRGLYHPKTPTGVASGAAGGSGGTAAPAATQPQQGDLKALDGSLALPGQALEPATLQDMSVAGAESVHGIDPLHHRHIAKP